MKNKIIAIQTMIILLFLFSNVESSSERRTIQMTLGKKEFTIDDTKKLQFDVAPMIVNGKLMVQARTLFSNNVISRTELKYMSATDNIFVYCDQPDIFFNGEEKNTILSLIEGARKSIDIQMYRIQDADVIKALMNARKKDRIRIRLILDKSEFNCNYIGNIDKTKESEKLEIRWKNTGAIMHRKLTVIDGETVVLGSTNWTENAFTKNWEITLITNDKDIASKILSEYDQEWDNNTDEDYCD